MNKETPSHTTMSCEQIHIETSSHSEKVLLCLLRAELAVLVVGLVVGVCWLIFGLMNLISSDDFIIESTILMIASIASANTIHSLAAFIYPASFNSLCDLTSAETENQGKEKGVL